MKAFVFALFTAMISQSGFAAEQNTIESLSLQLFSVQGEEKKHIVDSLVARGDRSLIPTLVLAMRLTGDNIHVAKALSALTGETIATWHDAYDWQEQHPEVVPDPSFRDLKLRFLGNTDRRFLDFFDNPDGSVKPLEIRLEEVHWGGVRLDEIVPLDAPAMSTAAEADYLLDDDLVFGVEINGDQRAYPLRILGWHEMLNDVVGGVPVSLAYCTLCGAGILYEGKTLANEEPFTFGSSGLLYRSNKLMYDRQTRSLWNQFTGHPVSGELAGSGIRLSVRPMTTTTWYSWRQQHPNTKVLSLKTGFNRDYGSGQAYKDYFASPDLMFPVFVDDESVLQRKDRVFGLLTTGAARAWPLSAFAQQTVINDQIGINSIVLIGSYESRTVRAYLKPADVTFLGTPDARGRFYSTDGRAWQLSENSLDSVTDDDRLPRLPGRLAYWFAWNSFHGVRSTLFSLD
ncbi:MAG: DUF3179 domain-containing protein [Pseudomonadota bacterium]